MATNKRISADAPPSQPAITGDARRALVGRPPSYREEYCQLVIEDALEGYSFGGFAGRIGVARATINLWRNRYPEFEEACARAQGGRQRYWESQAIDIANTGGKGGSQGTIVLAALYNAARDDWKNRQEVEVTGQITLASIVEASMKTIEAKVIESEPVELAPPSVEDLF